MFDHAIDTHSRIAETCYAGAVYVAGRSASSGNAALIATFLVIETLGFL